MKAMLDYNMIKIGAVIQARVSSTRLPGKILKELPYNSGITVLEQLIKRVKQSNAIDEIILATTEEDVDLPLLEIAKKENIRWFRGSRDNVLSRYYNSALANRLDVVVRVTSDNPCIDFKILDTFIKSHLRNQADYTSDKFEITFPCGTTGEVVSFPVLKEAYNNALKNFEREHVTPYIYQTCADKFKINMIEAKGVMRRPKIRLTLDMEEDYALLCSVYDYLYTEDNSFLTKDIIELFDKKPWLGFINKKVIPKKLHNTLEEEIEEAVKILQLQELKKASCFLEKSRINYFSKL